MALQVLKSFTTQISLFCIDMILQESALVLFDDVLLISNCEPHKLQIIKQFHDIANKENLKIAPEHFFFMLLTVKYLSHEIGFNTIKPIQCKIARIHKIPSPASKIELMRLLGSTNFNSKLIEKIRVIMKPSV